MDHLPEIIFITGTDGSGKSFFAKWLSDVLTEKGFRTTVIWSRFNNYISKPFLMFMRLTGHSYYKTVNGVKFGFHDFGSLGPLRYLFAVLQGIDVNIATYLRIIRRKEQCDLLICERGPWDTLVDVMADTGMKGLSESRIGRMYTRSIENKSVTLFIRRSRENILGSRPELVNDHKLERKIHFYELLSEINNWRLIDNNGSVPETRRQILSALNMDLPSS